MIGDGVKFEPFKVQNWFDCGKKETLLESNAKLLKKFGSNMAPDHHLENTIVIHPVNIASGCTIKNSIIGPNVAIRKKVIYQLFNIERDFHHQVIQPTYLILYLPIR